MAAQWYYGSGGGVRGPFDARTLAAMAERGDLRPADRVRQGAEGEWVEARQVKGLRFGQPEGSAGVTGEQPDRPAEVARPPRSPDRREYAPNAPLARRWQYRMVQIPTEIEVGGEVSAGGAAAGYLQRKVEEFAVLGWEFYRVDEIGVRINPGCLAGLLGGGPRYVSYYVITFRAPAAGFEQV